MTFGACIGADFVSSYANRLPRGGGQFAAAHNKLKQGIPGMMLSTTITVRQILEQKGSSAHAVAPAVSVLDALTLMAKQDIGSVLVIENERLVGIFTERDYARKLALKGLTSRDATVGDLMTPNVCTITPSHTIEAVMNIMTENRFRHLPVVEHGHIAGIVTIGDVVKAVIDLQEKTINHLSNYIAGDLTT